MKKNKLNSKLVNHLIQFIFIFSSVYFAFWLSNLAEVERIKKIEKTAIKAVYHELEENLEQLNEAYAFHETIRDQLFIYADSIEQGLIEASSLKPVDHLSKIFTRRANRLGFANLNRDAWETLKSSEAYVTLDYALASAIGALYRNQEKGVESTMQDIVKQIFSSKSQFDKNESEAMVFLTAWSFRELAGQEQYLAFNIKECMSLIEAHPDQQLKH